MKRGFKSQANKKAVLLRQELGLRPVDPLSAKRLAEHLDIGIVTPSDIPGMSDKNLEILAGSGQSQWSALTFPIRSEEFGRKNLIIHNETHPQVRRESDIMHEIAHIICEHTPSQLRPVGGTWFREHDTEMEEEATFLGGCLQIPNEAIIWAIMNRQMTDQQIADYYVASLQLVRMRKNFSGVISIQKNMRKRYGYRP